MTDLARAEPQRFFADRFDVTPLMERLIGSALRGQVDDADIYLEYRINEELVLEENVVKRASRHVSQGQGSGPRPDPAPATPTPTRSPSGTWRRRPGRRAPSPRTPGRPPWFR